MAQVSPARNAAFTILLAIERGRAHSDALLREPEFSRLSVLDRNFATALVLGVLRWQLALDARVRPLLRRPGAKLDLEVSIALRLGAFQILHMDRVPAHAAIDESVELARLASRRFASGMVNAVLRKLAAEGRMASAEDASAYPPWMVERWTSFLGSEAARAICRHGQLEPAHAIRLDGEDAERELAEAGVELAPGQLLRAARIVLEGDLTRTAAFREGRARIQDEGSQLVAEIAAGGGPIQPGAILDCCAAPGGKTLILAERNPHARIVACDSSPARLASLGQRLAVLGNRVECRLLDAQKIPEDGSFDLVLVDAPCSGTGTLARNPEIRHRLRPAEFARHSGRQRAILASAMRVARTGGRIVYSTCSLEPEENEHVIAAVLSENPQARILPMQTRIEEIERAGILAAGARDKLLGSVTREGYLRLLPGNHGTDGFFVALLEKSAAPA